MSKPETVDKTALMDIVLEEATVTLNRYIEDVESEAFRTPVLWEEWGLDDYPLKVKEPMDLGTIKTNLEKKIYTDLEVFLKDMKLVWSNCMVYNASKSDLYKIASKFKRRFERDQLRLQRIVDPDFKKEETLAERPKASPVSSQRATAMQKAEFCKNLYEISQVELGKVIQDIDATCKRALEKKTEEDLEINVDNIDLEVFLKLDEFVRGCIKAKKAKDASIKAALPVVNEKIETEKRPLEIADKNGTATTIEEPAEKKTKLEDEVTDS